MTELALLYLRDYPRNPDPTLAQIVIPDTAVWP